MAHRDPESQTPVPQDQAPGPPPPRLDCPCVFWYRLALRAAREAPCPCCGHVPQPLLDPPLDGPYDVKRSALLDGVLGIESAIQDLKAAVEEGVLP